MFNGLSIRAKWIFVFCLFLGYITGVFFGYPKLKNETTAKEYCVESVGPSNCQPYEDCDKECLKYEMKLESREKEVFYTYGLLGAFLGAWLFVFILTYILKE